MQIEKLTLGEYQTNTYIVYTDDPQCIVIDPGYEPEAIIAKVEELGKVVGAVFLTHGHFDHVGAMEVLQKHYGCETVSTKDEWKLPSSVTGLETLYTDHWYFGGYHRHIIGLRYDVIGTPGHTPGSVCLLFNKQYLFTGDTLFAGSVGRTDLPGGDREAMNDSLVKLKNLPGDYYVLPGHGEETTLQYERDNNIFLRNAK